VATALRRWQTSGDAMRTATVTTLVVASLALLASAAAAVERPSLYFLTASGSVLLPVQPSRTLTPNAALYRLAVVPASLRHRGLQSPFPVGSKPIHLSAARGIATVTLAGERLTSLHTIPRLRLIGAVTYTLTSYPTIRGIQFMLDGKPWGVYDHSGRVIRTYHRGTASNPWLTACAPGDGCFSP